MEIYTDGGCIENPGGIGAWAFVAVADGQVIHKASGTELETTNNRMELTAVIKAMEWARAQGLTECHVKTDSDLTVKCGNGLWKRKANLDLWDQFKAVFRFKGARWLRYQLSWVRGHSGNRWNEMADAMCTEEMGRLLAFREQRDARVAMEAA